MTTTAELRPDNDFANLMDIVYSGEGPMSHPQEVIGRALTQFIEREAQLAALRRDLAISGAMRWPWSQEAPISLRIEARVG